MSSTATALEITPPMNVGVYGTTRAGKTRFLYELLAAWNRDYRLVERSPEAIKFLQDIEPDIKAYNQSRGTVASLEGIKVVVQRPGEQPPWTLTFRDLRGEFLAQEVDDLRKAGKQAAIPRQVRECNAFVFFFDPTSEDAPDQIEAHHTRELRRATRFIDFVLAQRQNRYLPILFVLTRLDRWEKDQPTRKRAIAWIDRVNEHLRAAYRRGLGTHYPPRLVERNATTLCISSVRPQETEPVVERLADLVKDCAEFKTGDRGRTRSIIAAIAVLVGLFSAFAALAFFLVREPQKNAPGTRTPAKAVREWTADEVTTQLDELDRVLAVHPSGRTLPALADTKPLNEAFRWLPVKIEWTRADTNFTPKLRQRMQVTLERLITLVEAKLDPPPGEPLETRWQVVSQYLEDAPEVEQQPELERIRNRAWTLAQQQLAQQLATILKRREAVASPPADALIEVLTALRTQEQDLRRVRIGALKAQQALLAEVQTAATFLEDRKNTKRYAARFRLVGARLVQTNADEVRRGLAWNSPNEFFDATEAGFNVLLMPTRLDASEVTYRTRQADYEVRFGLGGPVLLRLLRWNETTEKFDDLHDFDLTAKGVAGPLRALGLPLLVPGQTTVQKKVEWQGYEITFELTDLPAVPALLTEAVARRAGEQP